MRNERGIDLEFSIKEQNEKHEVLISYFQEKDFIVRFNNGRGNMPKRSYNFTIKSNQGLRGHSDSRMSRNILSKVFFKSYSSRLL